MTKSVVETFSCPLDRLDVVAKAKDIARRNGLSFSAYIVELLEEETKKNGQAQPDPLNLVQPKKMSDITNTTLDLYIVSKNQIREHIDALAKQEDFDSIKMLNEKAINLTNQAVTKIKVKNNPKLAQTKYVSLNHDKSRIESRAYY